MDRFQIMVVLQIILAIIFFSIAIHIIFFGGPQKMPDTEIFLTNTTVVGQMIASIM